MKNVVFFLLERVRGFKSHPGKRLSLPLCGPISPLRANPSKWDKLEILGRISLARANSNFFITNAFRLRTANPVGQF